MQRLLFVRRVSMLTESHIDVRYPDCDPMGIVHHGVYPLWMEIGRLDFLSAAGYGYQAMNREGINPAMVDLHIQYRAPVRFPGRVTVKTVCSLCQGKKLELRYAVYPEGAGQPAAVGSSFHIWTGPGMQSLDLSAKPEIYNPLVSASEHPAVLILAGGRSRRMGQDKAQIELKGETLLTRAVSLWRKTLPEAKIYIALGQKDHRLNLPQNVTPIYDLSPDLGPMGGLQAAFRTTGEELFWVSAVDMPGLRPEAAALLSEKRCHCEDICAFSMDGRPEPLLGLYRSTCLPKIDELLDTGNGRMADLFGQVSVTLVPLPNKSWVRNVNTPEDLRQLQTASY